MLVVRLQILSKTRRATFSYLLTIELHSDQGRNFESELIKEMCEILGINKTRTTPYQPHSDRIVKRYNRTLATQLSMFVNENHSDWEEHLPTVLMAYRTAVHGSTGQTPARLMMGHELRVPLNLMFGQPPGSKDKCKSKFAKQLTESLELTHQFARNRLRLSSERMKNQYDIDLTKHCFEKKRQCVVIHISEKKRGYHQNFNVIGWDRLRL